MEKLTTLLLFAGLFYVMMRYGCGAHMVHGHGGHSHGGHSPSGPATDPVCGMTVAPGSGYTKTYADHEYRFCSRACLDKFDAKPDAYVPAAVR